MQSLKVSTDPKSQERTVDCPLYKIGVLVSTACKNCQYCSGFDEDAVKCEYSDRFVNALAKSKKLSSSYPTEGVFPTNPNDIVGGKRRSMIALDFVERDLHEPSIEELAEWFKLDLKEVKGEED